MSYRKAQQKSRVITPGIYNKIRDAFEYEHKFGRKRVRYEDVILPMREEMLVIEHIQSLIFGKAPEILPNHTPEDSMVDLKEFVLVKKVLFACCIPVDNELYIYPEIMKSILHEMKMSTRLFELCKAWDDNQSVKKSMKVQDSETRQRIAENYPYLAKFVSDSYTF